MPRRAGTRILTAGLFSLTFILTSLLLTSAGQAQDGRFDASVNLAAVFTKQSTGNGITQSATEGASFFGTFRLKFNSKHSIALNVGRGKDSQIYNTGFNFHVPSAITEYTGAYIFSPFRKGGFEPFVLAGGGALLFKPYSTWVFLPDINSGGVIIPNRVRVNLNASGQTKLALLYGLGTDYRLPHFARLALRLQYRGLYYSNPDFKVDSSSGSSISFFTRTKGHMAEPSAGLVFRF